MYAQNHRCIKIILTCSIVLGFSPFLDASFASLSKNDTFPLFTSHYPYEYLQKAAQLRYRGVPWAGKMGETFSISISGFLQNSNRGTSIEGEHSFDPTHPDTTTITELGDLTGRSSMIALLFGTPPAGQTFPTSLLEARAGLFPNIDPTVGIDNGAYIDPDQNFGYFSFPLRYAKRGFAFDIQLGWRDIGLTCKGRFSNIQQTSRGIVNKTADAQQQSRTGAEGTITAAQVDQFLMDQFPTIMKELNRDVGEFVKSSFDEIVVTAFFRHAFNGNFSRDKEWTEFCVIPFIEVAAIISPTRSRNFQEQFSLNFGNDKHNAVSVHGGIDIDFMYTISVGFDGGFTWFTTEDFEKVPVPNNEYQTTLFPFATDISVKPGLSTYFSAQMNVLYFIDKLSAYVQFIILEHREDTIELKVKDDAFLPHMLQENSSFRAKLVNAGFNYDLTPFFSLGVVAQIPFSQRNAYRSTNVLFTIEALF